MSTVDNTKALQIENKMLALSYATAGVAIFPSSGKVPLIPLWNRLDTEITPDEREAALDKYRAEHNGREPLHVGSTKDPAVVKMLFRKLRGPVPSIATGVNKIVVIDADSKDDGPRKMRALFEANGGLPAGAVDSPTKSDGIHFYFADPSGKFSNAAGLIKKDYGSDMRGRGGQVVAPGAKLEDGRTYGTKEDFGRFIRAFHGGTLPEIPEYIVTLIGTGGEAAQSVTDAELAPIIAELKTDWKDPAELFDPTIGTYDLDGLRKKSPEFAELWANPSDDCSDNRWKLAQLVMSEWKMSVCDLAVLFEQWDGAGSLTDDGKGTGNYRLRDVAREWHKNVDRFTSKGDAFGEVVDDEDEGDLSDATLQQHEIERRQREERAKKARKERERDEARMKLEADVAGDGDTPDAAKPTDAKTEKKDKQGPIIHRSVAMFESYTPSDDLIEGLLPAVGVAVIVADSNVGKTFLAIEMLDCVMRGNKFLGRNVDKGDVLLIAGEGRDGIKKRMAALHKVRPHDGEGIAVSYDLPVFDAAPEAATKKLERQIKAAQVQTGEPVRLVVLDNLIGMLGGGDLHKADGVKPMLDALDTLAAKLKLCFVIIHHQNRAGSTAGSFAIRASVDVMLHVTEEKFGVRRIKIDKSRDGSKDTKLAFKLRYIPLGTNKWGNEVGSCVVEPFGGPDVPAMGSVVDDEAPSIILLDRREDRVQAVLDVFDRQAQRDKEGGGTVAAALRNVSLPTRHIVDQLNKRRKADGMEELGSSTVQALIKGMVEDGGLEVGGTTRQPLYTVA